MTHAPPRHYSFDELPVDRPMAMLERRRVIGAQAMISHITLDKGFTLDIHRHDNEQFSAVLSGRIRFTFGPGGPGPITVGPGEVIHLPGGCPHAAEALERTVVLDIFSPPSAGTGIDRQ